MKPRILITLAAAVSLAVVAIGATAAGRGGLTRYSEPKPAADFSIQDLEGKTHTLADYQGKVLVLNFWATWCIPCKKEIPSLQRAYEQLQPDDIHLLAVDFGETPQEVKDYVATLDVTFPFGLDPNKTVSEAYYVGVLPTSFVIGPDGKVHMRVIGDYEWDNPQMIQELRALKGG